VDFSMHSSSAEPSEAKNSERNEKTNARQKIYRNVLKHKCFIDTPENRVDVPIQNLLKSMKCFSICLEL